MALLDKTLASLNTDDVRISSVQEVVAPSEIMGSLPVSNSAAEVVISARKSIKSIIHGTSDKLLVIIGPCSIHDPSAAMEYAHKLLKLKEKYNDKKTFSRTDMAVTVVLPGLIAGFVGYYFTNEYKNSNSL